MTHYCEHSILHYGREAVGWYRVETVQIHVCHGCAVELIRGGKVRVGGIDRVKQQQIINQIKDWEI